MSQILVIADSQKKINTLVHYLGDKYTFFADTSSLKKIIPVRFTCSESGELIPHYDFIADRQGIIERLRGAVASCGQTILVADDTLEGNIFSEFIVTTVQDLNCRFNRVHVEEFNRAGIKKAFANLLPMQLHRLAGYRTRLGIDYTIKSITGMTPETGTLYDLLPEHIFALGQLCERSDHVEKTVVKNSFTCQVKLKSTGGALLQCRLVKNAGKKIKIPNRDYARIIIKDLKGLDFKVTNVTRQVKDIPAPGPFTTATLVQDAFRVYNMKPAKTIKLAKRLFTGVDTGKSGRKGLITFYFTDTEYVNPQAVAGAREYIFNNYGVDYLPKKPPAAGKSIKNCEAIRPLDVTLHPRRIRKVVSEDQYKLYLLIWNRFIASQMSKAKMEVTSVELETEPDGRYYLQEMETKLVFRGYKQVYNDVAINEQVRPVSLPQEIRAGQVYKYKDVLLEMETPVIPKHFSEAALWQELYTAAIPAGRNMSKLVGILFAYQLLAQNEHELHPTPAGHRLYRYTKSSFPDIYNAGFLKKIETEIECVENGQKEHTIVIENFKKLLENRSLQDIAVIYENESGTSPGMQKRQCPLCAGQLRVMNEGVKYYHVCENFPEICRYKEAIAAPAEPGSKQDFCPDCGALLVVREGRYGRFMACSKYPHCTFTKPYSINVQCPVEGCDGHVVEKMTKDGQLFYGCSTFPKCKFASWLKPVNKLCDACGNLYLVVKSNELGEYFTCPKCNSNWEAGAATVKNKIKVDN